MSHGALTSRPALPTRASRARGRDGGEDMSQVLIQMHGHPGAGKSALARELGKAIGAVVLDKDVVASALILSGVPFAEAGGPSYEVMQAQAERLLEDGHSVILDSPCFWPTIETKTRAIAVEAGAAWFMIEAKCPDAVRDARLASRERLESNPESRDLGPMRPGMYHPDCERLVLDTTRPLARLVADAERYVRPAINSRSPLPAAPSRATERTLEVAP